MLAGFRVVHDHTVISWFASRNRFDEYDFFQHFLGSAAVRETFPQHDFKVYEAHQPWAPWFCDIAWDATWVLIYQRNAVVYLLCVTDTD